MSPRRGLVIVASSFFVGVLCGVLCGVLLGVQPDIFVAAVVLVLLEQPKNVRFLLTVLFALLRELVDASEKGNPTIYIGNIENSVVFIIGQVINQAEQEW